MFVDLKIEGCGIWRRLVAQQCKIKRYYLVNDDDNNLQSIYLGDSRGAGKNAPQMASRAGKCQNLLEVINYAAGRPNPTASLG